MKQKYVTRVILTLLLGSSLMLCTACREKESEAAAPTPVTTETPAPTEEPTPEPTETPTPEPTETPTPEPTIGTPNPWTETENLEEAEKGSGIRFSAPVEAALPKKDEGEMHFWKYRWMPGTIEAMYESVNDEMIVRVSTEAQGDELAGVYQNYSQTWDETLKGLTVHCKGDGENISVATFDVDNMHYSITFDPETEERGLTADELNSLVNGMQASPYNEEEEKVLPVVTADPTDETVEEGGACLYIATADNADSLEWHFVSPDGNTDIPYTDINKSFASLGVTGGDSEYLNLSNIPKVFDGWKSYCRFTAKDGTADSGAAVTHVTDKETPTPTPTPSLTPEPTSEPTPAPEEDDSRWAGTYYESYAGRGQINITGNDETYYVTVTWPGSAWQVAEWNFSGTFDGRGVLRYSNCSKVVTTYDDDGIGHPEEEYSGGSGYVELMGNGEEIRWTDDQEGTGDDAVFVKN